VAQLASSPADEHDLVRFSQAVAQSIPPRIRMPQRLVEVDPDTGPHDAAAVELARLLREPLDRYRLEPVYLDKVGQVRYARRYALRLLGCPEHAMADDVADIHHGDTFVALPKGGNQERGEALKDLQRRGVLMLSSIAESGVHA
jgi:hypothetical protein